MTETKEGTDEINRHVCVCVCVPLYLCTCGVKSAAGRTRTDVGF